jgi:hypothetical protein
MSANAGGSEAERDDAHDTLWDVEGSTGGQDSHSLAGGELFDIETADSGASLSAPSAQSATGGGSIDTGGQLSESLASPANVATAGGPAGDVPNNALRGKLKLEREREEWVANRVGNLQNTDIGVLPVCKCVEQYAQQPRLVISQSDEDADADNTVREPVRCCSCGDRFAAGGVVYGCECCAKYWCHICHHLAVRQLRGAMVWLLTGHANSRQHDPRRANPCQVLWHGVPLSVPFCPILRYVSRVAQRRPFWAVENPGDWEIMGPRHARHAVGTFWKRSIGSFCGGHRIPMMALKPRTRQLVCSSIALDVEAIDDITSHGVITWGTTIVCRQMFLVAGPSAQRQVVEQYWLPIPYMGTEMSVTTAYPRDPRCQAIVVSDSDLAAAGCPQITPPERPPSYVLARDTFARIVRRSDGSIFMIRPRGGGEGSGKALEEPIHNMTDRTGGGAGATARDREQDLIYLEPRTPLHAHVADGADPQTHTPQARSNVARSKSTWLSSSLGPAILHAVPAGSTHCATIVGIGRARDGPYKGLEAETGGNTLEKLISSHGGRHFIDVWFYQWKRFIAIYDARGNRRMPENTPAFMALSVTTNEFGALRRLHIAWHLQPWRIDGILKGCIDAYMHIPVSCSTFPCFT